MTLKGDLDSISLADVFQTLSMTQQEGTLFVQEGENRKAIFFSKDGVRLIHTGEKKGGKLGDMLVGLGKITMEQLEQALSMQQQRDGAKLGEVLTQLGFVTEKDIDAAVKVQIEEEIYDLFSWEGATFEFKEGPPGEGTFGAEGAPVTQLTFNINSLIMEAARRIDEWDLIEKAIPSQMEIFQLAKRVNPLEYTDQERVILRLLDGRRSVKELVEESHVPKFEVCKFLYRLIEQGKAQRSPFDALMAMGDDAVRSEKLADGVKFYEQALAGKVKKKSDQLKARQRLAQALEYLDRKKEAADQYKLIAEAKIEDKEIEGAINIWQKVIDLNPLDLENKERLINVYLENRTALDPNRSDVIRSLEFSLFKNGKSLAMAFAYAGQIDRAKEVLQRLLELTPSSVELRKALANIHFDAGEKAEAVEELDRVAQFLLSNRDFPELLEVYKKILKIDPSRGDVRKKIAMIENGEAVAAAAPSSRRGLVKGLLVVVALLLLLGGAGGLIFYEIRALTQWKQVEAEAEASWQRSFEPRALDAEAEKIALREQARGKVQEAAASFPYTPVPARAGKLLLRWAREEEDEHDQTETALNTQNKAVEARLEHFRKLAQDPGPLDVPRTVDEIAAILKEAARNPYAKQHLQSLDELRVRFLKLRRDAEDLLGAALAAEQEADRGGRYKDQYRIAWENWAGLHTAARRFPDLLDQIRFPIRIQTVPAGAKVFVNGVGPYDSPFTHFVKPREETALKISHRGYEDVGLQIPGLEWSQIHALEGDTPWIVLVQLTIVSLADPLRVELGSEKVLSDPAVCDGVLYAAMGFGKVIAIRLDQDRLIQASSLDTLSDDPLRRGFFTRLFLSSTHVFFPCEDGSVYALPKGPDVRAGKALRYDPRRPGGPNHSVYYRASAVLSADEKILVVGTDLGVTAFDAGTASILWQYLPESDNKSYSVPVCDEGRVYASVDLGFLVAIDLKGGPVNGAPLWKKKVDNSAIKSALAVRDGVLFLGTESGNLIAVDLAKAEADPREGAGQTILRVGPPIQCRPLFTGELVVITAGGSLCAYQYRRDESSLREAWRLELGGRSGKVSEAVLFGPSVFLGNEDGTLFSVDVATHKVRWERKSKGSVKVAPALDGDGTVFFLGEHASGVFVHPYKE